MATNGDTKNQTRHEQVAAPGLSETPHPGSFPGYWLIAPLLVSAAVVAGMMAWAGLEIAPRTRGFGAIAAAFLILACARSWLHRPAAGWQRRMRDFSEHVLLFVTISLLGVLASYPAAAATTGFVDPALARMDQLLHFDWIAWYLAVSHSPWLQFLSAAAYANIFASPLLLLGYFAWEHRRHDAQQFLLTFWLAAVITLVLFPLFPARGPLAFLWHGPIPYMPTSALYQEQVIGELRAHRITDIDLGALRGLVCAPSFHTVSAVLYMAAAWPIRRLRWILVVANVAMLLSTPIEGTHYLADMIAGALVAIAALIAVRLGLGYYWRRQRRAAIALP